FRISPLMTTIAFGLLMLFSLVLRRAFKVIRPIFRERAKINAAVTGRLTESLGGVRVIKGYHAEEREHSVFVEGVSRLLNNVLKSLTATSLLSLSAAALMGVHLILAGKLTLGSFFSYTAFLGYLAAPIFQIASVGTQLTEAIAGLERTREVLGELPEDEDPRRKIELESIRGEVVFEDVTFAYDPSKTVLHDVSFVAHPGTVTALV